MAAVTPSDARVFVLDMGKHARLVGRVMRRLALGGLLALVAIQLLWWSGMDAKAAHAGIACALSLFGLSALVVGGAWLLIWKASSRYRLLLGPTWVATDSNGSLREQVNRQEVAHLCEGAFGLVLVKQRGMTFRIPRSLNGYDVVRSELLAWLPLTPPGSPHFRPWLGVVRKLAIVLLSLLLVVCCALLLAMLNVLVQWLLSRL